jgi:hypothetical protein
MFRIEMFGIETFGIEIDVVFRIEIMFEIGQVDFVCYPFLGAKSTSIRDCVGLSVRRSVPPGSVPTMRDYVENDY